MLAAITRTAALSALAITLALGSAWAGAEDEDTSPDPLLRTIPADEWFSMVRGKTVTYRIGSDVWAYERYDPRGNGVSIQMADGTCLNGTWYHRNDEYCFRWLPELTSCFQHVRTDGEILIIPMENGVASGAVQTVASISNLALGCGPTLSS